MASKFKLIDNKNDTFSIVIKDKVLKVDIFLIENISEELATLIFNAVDKYDPTEASVTIYIDGEVYAYTFSDTGNTVDKIKDKN